MFAGKHRGGRAPLDETRPSPNRGGVTLPGEQPSDPVSGPGLEACEARVAPRPHWPWLACSLFLHVLALVLVWSAWGNPEEKTVYRVALAAYIPGPAGTGGGVGSADCAESNRETRTALSQVPENIRPLVTASETERSGVSPSKDIPAKPSPRPQTPPSRREAGTERTAKPKTPPPSLPQSGPAPAGAVSTEPLAPGAADQGNGRGGGGRDPHGAGQPGVVDGNGPLAAGQVDEPPVPLGRVSPVYPARARASRVEGSVVVRMVVDASGRPTDLRIHSAEPPGYFERTALDAARKMRFRPGRLRGRAVNAEVFLPIHFTLR